MSASALAADARRAIEADCSRLILEFYACLDEHRNADLATLFTASGTWVRLGEELVGPDGILEGISGREGWLTAHVVSNLRIEVRDESQARSSQYVTLYRHEGWDREARGPAPVVLPLGILHHRDELVREGDAWKFQRKTSSALMVDRERVHHYDRKA